MKDIAGVESSQNSVARAARHVSSRLTQVGPLPVLIILIALFFNKMAFSNLILARGDALLYFYPYWSAASQALRRFEIPLWNANLFMGAPFLANSQVGFFYPLNWPFWLALAPPYAVSATVLVHILIAGVGTYLAGRRCLRISRTGALLASVLFALGGYLTAQVEHVNQFQGLAWLPWYFATIGAGPGAIGSWRLAARKSSALGILFTLQLLAGHTQSAFISALGVGVWILALAATESIESVRKKGNDSSLFASFLFHLGTRGLPVVVGGLLALAIAGIQLLPTLELVSFSSRQGGLSAKEALSFSLHPLLLTRALLPTYNQPLFAEYVAVVPVIGLLLAIVGIWTGRRKPAVQALFILTVVGLFLALGLFNPINQLVVRLPGFNLFRVPARWLVIYAFGTALLAGRGWEAIMAGRPGRDIREPAKLGLIALAVLMAWGLLSVPLSGIVPVGAESPAEWPSFVTGVAWLIELSLGYLLIARYLKHGNRLNMFVLFLLVLVVLFTFSRNLPYNNLTTPEAYFDLRPPGAYLQANAECQADQFACRTPTGRFLSLSNVFFDPGDQAEIDSIYADQLTESALYDYTIAIKQKEIIAPNLSLAYQLPSVDGFDGGILPLRDYTLLTSIILPDGQETTDGRLRELLRSKPQDKWLDLFNAKFLIMDKVGDMWRNEVFFDLHHPVTLYPDGQPVSVGYLPAFEATEIWLVSSGQPGTVEVAMANGEVSRLAPKHEGEDLLIIELPEAGLLQDVLLHPCSETTSQQPDCAPEWRVGGLSLVNQREGIFHPIVVGNYRLVHSGDVKIYENLDVLPRAFLVYDWEFKPDRETSLRAMRQEAFDPGSEAVLVGEALETGPGSGDGDLEFLSYQSEKISLQTRSEAEALLVLTDANYPGWQVQVDGAPAEIHQANVLFRGVRVPPGVHEVTFSYESNSFSRGQLVSLLGLTGWLALTFFGFSRFLRK